jgi:hypothetical protein
MEAENQNGFSFLFPSFPTSFSFSCVLWLTLLFSLSKPHDYWLKEEGKADVKEGGS